MKKILYIDSPFSETGDAANFRSQFIWNILCKSCDADLLLVKSEEFLTKTFPEHKGFEQIYALAATRMNPLKPKALYQFSRENLDKLAHILQTKRYEMIFFRSPEFAQIILFAEHILPDCNIIIDVEKLPSEEALVLWQQNPVGKNLKAKLEWLLLKNTEKELFRKNFFFLFTTNKLKQTCLKQFELKDDSTNLALLPNVLPETDTADALKDISATEEKLLQDKFILFYGNLDETVNLDAFLYLTRDIYPRVSKKMQEKDVKLYIVGRNHQKLHEQYSGGRIKLIGSVENIFIYIKASLFVVLPFRIPGSSGARILEAAMMQKAILTTSFGVAEFEFTADEVAAENNVDDYCNRLIELLQKPRQANELGQNLHNSVKQTFSRKRIEQQFTAFIENLKDRHSAESPKSKFSIALVANNFRPESDKLSYHIWQLAKKLAVKEEVTIFCPRRDHKPKREVIDNITIYRLFDVLNYPIEFPNYKARTFCPELFIKLLKQEFDIIQCYPGLNSNYTAAFLASKIKEIPIILNVFDFQDYEQICQEAGKVDAETLKQIDINWFNSALLKNTDYLFTVTEKDYTILRKLNERLEHIPLPVMLSDHEGELSSVREKHNISSNTFIFLCLGKISFLKGQDIALKAFVKALPAMPDSKLIYVGKTDLEPDFFEDLEAFVNKEALQDEVLFTGEVDKEEVSAWLKEADILIVPARLMNVGNVVIESWASHTPVLQSDAVDPNLVIEGDNGYLFRSQDIDDLAQQMQKAYSERARLPLLAEHGKAIVNDKYTFDYLLKRYSKVYKQLTLGA